MSAMATAVALVAMPAAHAAEGAGGRPVAGTGVHPNAGIVPPQPAWLGNLTVLQWRGDIGTERQVPIAGRVSLGAENTFSLVNVALTRAWGSGPSASSRSATTAARSPIGSRVSRAARSPSGRRWSGRPLGASPLTASRRWMATVYARDRFDRDTVMLTATMPF
jgi:hypothetical protein